MRTSLILSFLILTPSIANAHWGHVGELAGHGHWIAVGAGVVAAGLAALLGKKNDDAEITDGDEEEVVEGDGELEGAAS